MRAPLALLLGFVTVAVACGGKTNSGPGQPGDGGSSSSSSGGGSGSSGGSSSGGSSSGSSSGGASCTPLPGCASSVECPLPGGCGFCDCDDGQWACSGTGCGDDESDGFPVEDAPIEVCPLGAPPEQSLCGPIGTSCFYPVDNSCGEEECDCDPSGTWGCYELDCFDGGPPDTGVPDGSFFDAGPCPGNQPAPSSACSDEGLVCSYFDGCETNCLCSGMGWVCAAEGPCPSPPPPGG